MPEPTPKSYGMIGEFRTAAGVLHAAENPVDAVAVLGALRSPGLACGDDDLVIWHQGDGTCEKQSAFQPLVDAAITRAIGRVLAEGIRKEPAESGLTAGMVAAMASWAIYGVVKEWFITEGRVPAEEMVDKVVELVMPILMAGGVPAMHHA